MRLELALTISDTIRIDDAYINGGSKLCSSDQERGKGCEEHRELGLVSERAGARAAQQAIEQHLAFARRPLVFWHAVVRALQRSSRYMGSAAALAETIQHRPRRVRVGARVVHRVGIDGVRNDAHLHRVDPCRALAAHDRGRVLHVRVDDAHVVRPPLGIGSAIVDDHHFLRVAPGRRECRGHSADDGHYVAPRCVDHVRLDGRGGEARLEVRGCRVGEPAVGMGDGLENPAACLCNLILGEQFEEVVAGATKAFA